MKNTFQFKKSVFTKNRPCKNTTFQHISSFYFFKIFNHIKMYFINTLYFISFFAISNFELIIFFFKRE